VIGTTRQAQKQRKQMDPTEQMAKALLQDIRRYLPEATFFQREDLLHLPTFQSVATITRYARVCESVGYLLSTRRLVLLSRTDLCLPDKASEYEDMADLTGRYEQTVRRLLMRAGDDLSVPNLIRLWTSDPHLTDNCKRIAIRENMKKLAKTGLLAKDGFSGYHRRKDSA
jgi:hypothetical protein